MSAVFTFTCNRTWWDCGCTWWHQLEDGRWVLRSHPCGRHAGVMP